MLQPFKASVCNVLVGFQVSVDDAVVVKVLQRQDSLCEVHPSHVHWQRSNVLQQCGAVSACRGAVFTLKHIHLRS